MVVAVEGVVVIIDAGGSVVEAAARVPVGNENKRLSNEYCDWNTFVGISR